MSDLYFWIPHQEYVWMPGRLLKKSSKVWTYGLYNNEQIELPASECETLENASDKSLKGCVDNLINLNEFGEGAVVHQLRQRYKNDNIYTSIGNILISVNPFKQLSIYNAFVVDAYRKHERKDPHIFKLASEAFQGLYEENAHQAIIISGESGAGKTEATKLVLQYLSDVAGSDDGVEQQMLSSTPLLESFGNAKTTHNDNSSRFGKWIEVQFGADRTIISSKIVEYLLEKSRIVTRPPNEQNYHIFYQLFSGLEQETRTTLKIDGEMKSYNYLQGSPEDCIGPDQAEEFKSTVQALKRLSFSNTDISNTFTIIATVLNIGNINFKEVTFDYNTGCEVANRDQLKIVATQLGIDAESSLEIALCYKLMAIRGSRTQTPMTVDKAEESRDALAKELYSKLFHWIVMRINRTLSRQFTEKGEYVIGILDLFGFENFDANGFEQFCINYCNEKLQQLFTQFLFKQEQDLYKKRTNFCTTIAGVLRQYSLFRIT